MRKKYLKLTAEQKARGVIFSSRLVGRTMPSDIIHEVTDDMPDKWERIERLMNDKFFNKSPYEYNEVRQ